MSREWKLTPAKRSERSLLRIGAAQAAAEKVIALRTWRQGRAAAAKKAREQEKAERTYQNRGVDRVPEHLDAGNPLQRAPYNDAFDDEGSPVGVRPYLVSKRRTELAQPDDLDPRGNYRTRRLHGERGKPRRVRRRELPGAVERRLERRRQEWLA